MSRYRCSTTSPRVTPRPPNSCTARSMTRCADSVRTSSPWRCPWSAPVGVVAQPRSLVGLQPGGVQLGGHVSKPCLHQGQIRQRLAEDRPRDRVCHGFVEGALPEAQRRTGHRGAKDVERAHGEFEALTLGAEAVGGRNAAAIEGQGSQGVRCDEINALGNAEPGRIGIHHEGTGCHAPASSRPPGSAAGSCARTRSRSAIPPLRSRSWCHRARIIAIAGGATLDGRHVRAGLRFRERKGGDALCRRPLPAGSGA